MKDYKLSELKKICKETSNCSKCSLRLLCFCVENSGFYAIEIDEVEDEN